MRSSRSYSIFFMETDVEFGLSMYVFLKFFFPTYVLKGTLAKENNFFEETGYRVIRYLRNDNIS
jgi:hypothetical protein